MKSEFDPQEELGKRALEEAEEIIQSINDDDTSTLDLSNLGLTVLPRSIIKLENLVKLDISNNKITLLHLDGSKLKLLKEIDARNNDIITISEKFSRLSSLEKLDLSNNRIYNLENIKNITSLKTIDLSNNFLTRIPEELKSLRNLDEINASNNSIETLDFSKNELVNVSKIVLDKNKIKTITGELSTLTNLSELYLGNNQLTSLPSDIGKLFKLQILSLESNRLEHLPGSIKEISSLRVLLIHDNSKLGLPPEIVGPKREDIISGESGAFAGDILEYYFNSKHLNAPIMEAKLLLVGYGAVGKTSLVNRLIRDNFNPNETKTDGIEISEWSFETDSAEKVRLNVWDFGGQEIMHSTHQFFLTIRSLYILVLSGRRGREDDDAEYWLSIIESFGRDSPTIVVLNKINEHHFDVNRRGLKKKYPFIKKFIETDCRDNIGISELREIVRLETNQLEHLRDIFPRRWFGIKKYLSELKNDFNYITYTEYREVCHNHGEPNSVNQDILATHLHNLGIILSFKDDPRLRDTHVLKPKWVTTGIYKIINSPLLAMHHGELSIKDLKDILDPNEYPIERHSFIIDLMKKFDLCFAYTHIEDTYLVAQLLNKEEPKDIYLFEYDLSLDFEYKYPVYPEGILPRFIVKTNVLSSPKSRWLTGVILEFEENKALVRAKRSEKKIEISIVGSFAGRRRLLTIIRSEFNQIHKSFDFRPEELIPLPGYSGYSVSYNDLVVMEKRGVRYFPRVIGDDVERFDVSFLLNGVDVAQERFKKRQTTFSSDRKNIFISYSHKDERFLNELSIHLKFLEQQDKIRSWNDKKILPGDKWEEKIDRNLEQASCVLFLLSPDFLASKYCYDKEFKRALEKHKSGAIQIVPILVRDTILDETPFSDFQILPNNNTAIALWENRDQAWNHVINELRKIL